MVALDFETVGYDLVGGHIKDGDYFDKGCFCGTFTMDLEEEPCSGPGQLEFTKERLWINATCGPTSLPDDWTEKLMTTQFSFIPIEDWRWPMCVADMPKHVTELTDQCTTDACEIDSSGYCNDWHGLPDNWHQLAVPTPSELIPWGWTISRFLGLTITNVTSLASASVTEICPANEWKLTSFALVNISTFLAVLLGLRIRLCPNKRSSQKHSYTWSWLLKGAFIVALQLLANLLNALIVQSSPGYAHIPVLQLMLLWCSVPRLTWLAMIFLVDAQSSEPRNVSMAASLSFAELFLQSLSSYHMMMTINYGREHNLYFGGRKIGQPATFMYAGALMWLITVGMALIQLTRTARRMKRLTDLDAPYRPMRQGDKYWQATLELETFRMMAALNGWCTRLKEDLTLQQSPSSEETPFAIRQNRDCAPNSAVYGTFSDQGHRRWSSQKVKVSEYHAIAVLSMFLFWIAQSMFWGGFILLTSDE
ncbi:hypothetical protein N7488_004676 [Penicillium malachiteum]|nr:hypothetical protein N7488_004676 [Penicillium malachiteum]